MDLRLATIDDARMLFEWRNDPLTRAQSHSTGVIDYPSHLKWLSHSLMLPTRRIYIAEIDSVAVGTVRTDQGADSTEISWTVAPDARGHGIGTRMVQALIATLNGPLRAEIKVNNVASLRIAQRCGFEIEKDVNGVMHLRLLNPQLDRSRQGL